MNRFAAQRAFFAEHPGVALDEKRLSIVKPTSRDVDYIFANLWDRGREEFRLLGMSLFDASERFKHYVRAGIVRYVALSLAEPVMIGGIMLERTESYTWVQATDKFDRYWKELTKIIREVTRDYRSDPLHIYSCCVHPKTERWFNLLGYYADGYTELSKAGALVRRFKRK
jgi:hypothetical protein